MNYSALPLPSRPHNNIFPMVVAKSTKLLKAMLALCGFQATEAIIKKRGSLNIPSLLHCFETKPPPSSNRIAYKLRLWLRQSYHRRPLLNLIWELHFSSSKVRILVSQPLLYDYPAIRCGSGTLSSHYNAYGMLAIWRSISYNLQVISLSCSWKRVECKGASAEVKGPLTLFALCTHHPFHFPTPISLGVAPNSS